MAEEKSEGVKGTISGWIKGLGTSIVGLISGAALMYVTPLFNSVVKPPTPVANFAVQVNGLTAQFNNRSTGGTQGWWDFGDGTALEPFDPAAEIVKHAYAKPGSYQVKLSLQNLFNEENQRTTSVAVDGSASAGNGPDVDEFDLVPLGGREQAPAVYQLKCKVKNAAYCVLVRDNGPIEIVDNPNDRYFSFDDMGAYTVRLAAVQGKQVVEKSKTVYVSPGGDDPMAKMLVSYEAIKVERLTKDWKIGCTWTAGAKDGTSSFRQVRPAPADGVIVSAVLLNKDDKNGPVRNVKLEVSPDKSQVILTGELVKATGLLAPKTNPSWLADVRAVIERRSAPQRIDRGEVMMAARLNTSINLPMQPLGDGWEMVKKQVTVELWDGNRKVWDTSKGASGGNVTLKNQPCQVATTMNKDSVTFQVTCKTIAGINPPAVLPPSMTLPKAPEPVGPIRPASFERNPLKQFFPKTK
jgi:PKD repeat protein